MLICLRASHAEPLPRTDPPCLRTQGLGPRRQRAPRRRRQRGRVGARPARPGARDAVVPAHPPPAPARVCRAAHGAPLSVPSHAMVGMSRTGPNKAGRPSTLLDSESQSKAATNAATLFEGSQADSKAAWVKQSRGLWSGGSTEGPLLVLCLLLPLIVACYWCARLAQRQSLRRHQAETKPQKALSTLML